ncbi:hypothetical protein BV22DRAFT_1104961 [Leucogyrophana mollusca]|uniref:Uncharacterized protein n=1 Tax=Leucogyrophana mollusca TaxID=85980 RepID=A0ACB8BHN1_9AGAM|nr:hypothetical protein BV22DRAFT_1104961 [Leucogyrophana mollusca]
MTGNRSRWERRRPGDERELPDSLDRRQVLRAVLHSILLHRLFGTVKPHTFEVLDVTMPGVVVPGMEVLVNVFWKALESSVHKRSQVCPGKVHGEEDVTWEQWIVNAELRQPNSEQDRLTFNATLSTALSTAPRAMLTHTASVARVPPITTSAGISPFPVRIGVRVGGEGGRGVEVA